MRGTAAEAATYEGEVDRRLAALRGKPADATLPAGTVPPEPEPVRTIVDLCDPGGERLRVEHDGRDGRRYLTIGEPDDERPFELAHGATGALFGALCALDASPGGKAVQQGAAAVKTGTGCDVRAALIGEALRLLHGLSVEDLRGLVQRLVGRSQALAWGDRMRLRARRRAVTRSAEVGGTKVHVGTASDEAGEIREVWIDVAKEGSPVRGLLHVIAGLASVALQHGAPLAMVSKILSEPEFEPRGHVEGCEDGITEAHSIPHYVAQVLRLGGQ